METVSEAGGARSTAKRLIVPGIALGFLAFGIVGWDLSDWRWGVLGVALYAIPLACCVFRSAAIRAWGLWFGVFLVAQTALARLLPFPPNDYVTLPPNMHVMADSRATDLHGISGLQTVTTDGHGFRVQPPVNYDQSDVLRIFAIGGSTTECLSLDDNATWPHLLQEGLSAVLGKPVQVVNTGVSGSRARYHLTTLHYAVDLHPSAAIILVGANDWVRQIQRHFGTLPLWLEDIQLKHTLLALALQRGMAAIANLFDQHGARAEVPVDYGVDVRRWQHSLDRPDKRRFTPETVEPSYADYLERISALCHEQNLTCIFVTQPNAYSPDASEAMRATFWMTPGFKSYTLPLEDMVRIATLYNRFLTDFARQHGDKLCDLALALAPTFDNYYDDEHFNTSGARNVANYLVPCIAAALVGH